MNKKYTVAGICAAALVGSLGVTGVCAETYDLPDDYRVSGGKISYDFSDSASVSDFAVYTEFDRSPTVTDERMVCWSLAEQKIVYKNAMYSDVDVSVDIGTINKNGKFDAGIYVGLKSGVTGALDGVTGYCVNIERGASESKYYLKLHEFDRRWLGTRKETVLVLPLNVVRLRVVVKNGTLYAFAGETNTPQLTYNAGDLFGYVGFRSFYSPNTFDNIEIIGSANEPNTEQLNALVLRAREIADIVTDESRASLDAALTSAERAAESENAYDIDTAVTQLKTAIDSAVVKRDYSVLVQWIAEADRISNTDGKTYTANSWASFCKVLEMCKCFTAESDPEQISYWAGRLRLRLDTLVELKGAEI